MKRLTARLIKAFFAFCLCLACVTLLSSTGHSRDLSHSLAGKGQSSGGQTNSRSQRPADFFVGPAGKDSNDGSQTHPWATITYAGKVASPGSVIHVLAGTYNERVVTTANGTPDARIKYVSERKWRAVIAPAAHGSVVWLNSGDYTDIDDFEIAGTDCNGIDLVGSHQRAIGNNVHNAADGCSNSSGGSAIADGNYKSEDNNIIANYVHDVGVGDPLCAQTGHRTIQGIYQSNRGGSIVNNLVVHNCVFGIHLWHAATHATIINNTVVYNLGGGILVGTGDAPCNEGGCPGGDDYTVVRNNIASFNGNPILKGWCITESSGDVGIHNQYSNNLTYQNASGDFAVEHHLICEDCIQGKDPGFVDPFSGDFHLKADSPARARGSDRDAPRADIDNNSITGSLIDIGAYQGGRNQ